MSNSHLLIEIRPIRMSDCTQEYADWLSDPKVNGYLETRHERQTLERVRKYVQSMLRSEDQHLFAITANARHIGNIKLGPINRHHMYADLAYFIGDTRYWNQGVATKAIALMLDYGFRTLGLNCVKAGYYNDNAGSRSALIKNGFQQDGFVHKQLKDNAGMWTDHVLMSILAEDWLKASSASL